MKNDLNSNRISSFVTILILLTALSIYSSLAFAGPGDPVVDTRTPTSTVTGDEIKNLPTSGRNLQDLIDTLPKTPADTTGRQPNIRGVSNEGTPGTNTVTGAGTNTFGDPSRIRYDSPTIAGFTLSSNWGETYDQNWGGGYKPYEWKITAGLEYKFNDKLSTTSSYTSTNTCPAGYTFGLCGTNCGFGSYCDIKPGPCWKCISIENNDPFQINLSLNTPSVSTPQSCSDYVGYTDSCFSCSRRGLECKMERPRGARIKCAKCLGCPEGTGTWGACQLGCEAFGGGICEYDHTTSEGVKCYFCDDPYDCQEVGQVCSCIHCPFGSRCVPGTLAIDEFGEPQRCYICLPNSLIGYGSNFNYFVPSIQAPPIRYILADKLKDGPALQPLSIMTLASVEAVPDIGASQKDLQPISKVFDTSGGSQGTLQELAGQIRESLAKTRKFSDDSFGGLTPASTNQRPSGGGEAFGKDGSKDYIVNGPVLAAGRIGSQDVLAVYDANGVLIGMIPRDELEKNPDVLANLLALAERANQEIEKISERAKIIQRADQRFIAPYKKLDGGPNDDLFRYSKKKKKKGILGILGGGEGGNKSPLRIGGGDGAFGPILSSAGESKEDVKDQWGLHMIGYTSSSDPASAWNKINGADRNVVVAVIDSGLDVYHPDGPAHIWFNRGEIPHNKIDDDGNGYVDDYNGWNFLNEGTDIRDYNGHGTFVAGIIAAKRDNEIGIAGINPGAVIMPLKVANEEGISVSLSVFRAIHYAVNNGARVINVSLGARGISALEQSAINYAYAHGVFVAVASGNNGLYIGGLGPASAKRAFTVGALDMKGRRSTISSWGPNNAIMAPGELIYSIRSKDSMKKTIKDPFKRLYFAQSGTSFSTPMVSATASLLIARDSKLTGKEIERILVATADDMDEPGWDDSTGAGMLNAGNAFARRNVSKPNVKITEFRPNFNDRGKIVSVDVFATVEGNIKNFTLGVGKGKRAKKFRQVAGPFKKQAANSWIARVDVRENLKGSKEWIVQIKATDNSGKEATAQALLQLTKNPTR